MFNLSIHQTLRGLPAGLVTKSILKLVPGLFMIAFFVVGALSVVTKRSTYELQGGAWWNGEASARYEQHFNANLPLKDAYVSTWGILEYGLFRQAQEGALLGEEGWFYTTEELAYYPNEAELIAEKLSYISAVRDTLAAQGIDLVVTLVPAKARIYPEYLGFNLPDYVAERYDHELEALTEAGIITIDLREAMLAAKDAGQAYFKTDTHWTPQAARFAAEAVRRALEAEAFNLAFDESTFSSNLEGRVSQFEGDLLQFLPLGVLKATLAPAAERVQMVTTVQTNVSLFADISRPITLVGTSYSADARWNFEGALKESLGMNVLNAALVGRGEVVPMETYLASDNLRDNKPQLVIWQLSERALPMSAELEARSAFAADMLSEEQ